ncbi:MAG: leucine-rich repeat protein [Bacteroidales bacterium]|nr:leucine-rich repeat protein [Bacteroidales bacterium]MDD4822718.1 leucine-rich repeat protein [Bacteroidales bacterium]
MKEEQNPVERVQTTKTTPEKENVAPRKNTNPDTKASFSEQFWENHIHVFIYHWNEIAKLTDPEYKKSEINSLSGYSRLVNGKNVTTQVIVEGIHDLILRTNCSMHFDESTQFAMDCIENGLEFGLVQMKNGAAVAGAKIIPFFTHNRGYKALTSSEKEKIKRYTPQIIYKKCPLANEEIIVGKFTCNCNPGGLTLHLIGTTREINGEMILPDSYQYENCQYQITAIAGQAFQQTKITSVFLSKYVVHIGTRAFAKCRNLQSAVITKKVSEIGKEAFLHCPLKMIYSLNPKPPKMIGNTFGNLDYDNCILVIPEKSFEAYASAKEWEKFKIVRPLTKKISLKL